MFGAETLDHIAIPVTDLPRAEKFYLETVGLQFLTRRKNADGSPRHTYVKAGDNIIGLNLPGIQVPASPSGAPRYAIAVQSDEVFASVVARIREARVRCGAVEEFPASSPFAKSFSFDDHDDNHIEICIRRQGMGETFLSHVVFETTDLKKGKRFYVEALGLRPAGEERGETLLEFPNHQMIGLKEVPALSDRTKKHGRAVHVAFNVRREDFDEMASLVPQRDGKAHGDFRAADGLRPPGERSLYLFDPDTNELQITAHGEENWDLLPDEEKWRRTIENRRRQGKGISRFDTGRKDSH